MQTKYIGVVAGVLGLLGLAIQYGPSLAIERWAESGFEGAVPTIGTVGQTVVAYSLLIDSIGPLVTLALAVGLGYSVAHRVDIAREYRRIIGAIAIGSTAGVTLAGAPILVASASSTSDGVTVFLLLASLASMLVSVALLVTVGALAGAAIAHFRTIDGDPSRPTEDGTGTDSDPDSPSETYSKSTADASQTRSEPTR